MRSAHLLDRPSADATGTHELLVLWQHPESREIIPIGRFAHDSGLYRFAYTRAAALVPDFRPLPGLEDLHGRYVSPKLPPVFGQRVMETDRPDYAEYASSIGLDPDNASPWEQIVLSGGERAGDTLQFMQLPTVAGGRARARFFANGIRHITERARSVRGQLIHVTVEDHERALQSLSVGDMIRIEAEDDNPIDHDACLVTTDGTPVGWVPRALSTSIRRLLSAGALAATVARIGPPSTPSHLRLVLALDVAAPPDFSFDADGVWEPIDPQ